ncbi:MAG TPA: translocation/assembly module TamB domain-containing protein [Kofleriaceae bacterium]|nr:translocation/assembly module TamB domain-containing protein [Kofleriaceae bacterium]
MSTARPEDSRSGARRARRWFVRGALGVLASLAIVVLAAVIAVHTTWGRDVVRAQVQDRLQTMFTGGATVGRIDGSPFGKLTLHDLVINGPDRRPAISVKSLTVQVGILPLLSHQARVGGIVADEADVDLRRDASGELQIKHLMKPGPGSAWSVDLPSIELRRGHLRLDTGREVMNFDALAIDGRAKLPHGGPIDASLELSGTWRERTAAALDLKVVMHSDDRGLAVPFLAAHAGDVSVLGNHVTITPRQGRAPLIGGAVIARASADAVARLLPDVKLPADLAVMVTAAPMPDQTWTQLVVSGTVDRTPVWFQGAADLEARHARGELSTGTLELGKLSSGKLEGTGAARIVFDARPGGPDALPVATATVHGWGRVFGVPTTRFEAALSSAGERVRGTFDARGDGVRVSASGSVRAHRELLAIEGAILHATSSDPARASGGKAPVHGTLRADLTASGTLRPSPSLAVAGTVSGRHLRVRDLSAASLHVAIDAARLPNRPLGTAHVELVDLVRGERQLGKLTVDAEDRPDGKVAVAVRSRPKENPWLIDADVLVTPPAEAGPRTVEIEVERHHVRAGNGTDWNGRTGHIEVAPARIAIRDFVSTSAFGRVALSGDYERTGGRRGDLTAKLDAAGLSLDNLSRRHHGKLDAHVAIERRRGAWDGEVQVDGTRLSMDPKTTLADLHAHAALHAGQLAITADTTSAGLGSARLAFDLDVPGGRAFTDPRAWKRLGREAIRRGELTVRGLEVSRAAELAGIDGDYAGRIDADIRISHDAAGGRIEARNVVAPQLRGLGGPGGATLVLDLSQPSPTELAPALAASIEGVGRLSAQARLALPERLLDPAAWQALGRGALRGAGMRAENIAIDPAMLDRFGITSELRGRLSVALDVGEAGRELQATVDLDDLRGDPIVTPIDLHIGATSDERTTTASLTVKTGGTIPGKTTAPASKLAGNLGPGATLLEAQGKIPASIVALIQRRRTEPGVETTVPLAATIKLATVQAPAMLGVFGRTEIIAGTLDGVVEIGGTIGRPTAKANLTARGIKVPPGPRGKPVRTVERLVVTGSWDGDAAHVDVDGVESEGGLLKIALVARPSALRDGSLKLKAEKFDLIPVLAFAPGPAGGAAGRLDADLALQGLDLRTTQIAGEVHLADARVPIAPDVGTLRRAKLDAVIADHEVKLNIDGRLGGGTVAMNGTVALDGAAPNGGKAKITLRKVSPIGVVEPQVSADVAATLSRDQNRWHAELVVDHANVIVPKDRGEKLKPVGPPPDMRFASGKPLGGGATDNAPPANPIFVVTIHLRSTRIESEEFRGLVKGQLEIQADGGSIGVTGGIDADRGDLDLFGRRYFIERAGVHFDGSVDPLLDIRISHEFPEVTTVTEVRGRLSRPELTMSSDPGTYSQGQLLGFLLGGDPGGDPQQSSMSSTVTDAGTSLVANKLSGYVRSALPVDVDVLRYEAATASSGPAVVVGTWLTHSLFVAYRQHLESSHDQNLAEGEVEYWLSRRLVVEGTAGDRGYHGLDLLWRLRY